VAKFVAVLLALLVLASVASADLAVQVWPDKLQVRPGEPVQLQVTVTGLTAGQTAAVQCRVARLLDQEAAKYDGTTDAAGKVSFTFKPTAEFGYEVTATATAGGQEARGREVFACAQNPWSACVAYGGDSLRSWNMPKPGEQYDPYITKRIADWVADWRTNYESVGEILGIAYDPFSSVAPPPGIDNYFSGQGDTAYRSTVSGLKKLTSDLHANGIYSTVYVNSSVSGVGGTEFARKHPEYLIFTRDGSVFGGLNTQTLPLLQRFYQQYPASLTDKEFQPIIDSISPGGLHIAPLNFEHPELAHLGAESIIRGREVLGYDGVRYDGHYSVPAIGDPLAPSSMYLDYAGKPQPSVRDGDALTARNMKLTMTESRAKYSDFLFGFNWAGFRPDNGDWVMSSKEAATIAPGSYILDEVAKGAGEAAAPDNRWVDFARNMTEEAERARKFGAFLFAGWGGGPGYNEVDTRWIKAFSWAGGFRWIPGDNRNNKAAWRLYNQFAFRYSEFLLSNTLHRLPLEEATKLVQVTASRPIVYERFVEQLQNADGRFLVINLINSPVEERITQQAAVPPVAENVQVTLAPELFAGGAPRLAEARVLNPDATEQSQTLPLQAAGGKFTATVPSFSYWSVLVIPY
jgi:hypothetical protein